jgi:hypothetical protein
MKTLPALVACLLALAAATPALADPPAKRIRRFAYVIGADNGGADRVKLRYAGTDAARMARLIRELGGVAPADLVLLRASDAKQVRAGFNRLERLLAGAARPGVRRELVLYYSGHSDERGLLLSGQRVSYRALRDQLGRMPADVTIAILDSCASGAFTRTKGGSRQPAFLVDQSNQVEGYAFISSSSETEVAQESDRIAASYFTHYLISGLRGAADSNRDGRVTLNEAYQFAFAETVSSTQTTLGGTQHPAYQMHLAGSGDVVMTDLRSTSARLMVSKQVSGRLFIRDRGGNLVLEVQKAPGQPMVLGLAPGSYEVMLERGDGQSPARARVALRLGSRAVLATSSFRRVEAEVAVARGDRQSVPDQVPVSLTIVPPLSTTLTMRPVVKNLSLNLFAGVAAELRGLEVSGWLSIVTGDVRGLQVSGLGNVVLEDATGLQVAGIGNVTTGAVNGFQLAAVGNYAGEVRRGVQAAAIANAAMGDVRGLQAAAITNLALGRVDGLQLSAITNLAESVRGGQVGMVNMARRVDGFQLGLVNIAEDSDASIGLVNLIRNGYHALEVSGSDTTPVEITAKLGSRRFYTFLGGGVDRDRLQLGGGAGLHTPRPGYYIDVDALAYNVVDHSFREADVDLLAKLRGSFGWRINENLALFAGAHLSGAFAFHGDPVAQVSFIDGPMLETDRVVVRISPGLFAGVHIE